MIVNATDCYQKFVVCVLGRDMQQETSVTKFRKIREDILDVTREDVLRNTPRTISLSSIRNAELGKRVSPRTAKQLLTAINVLLQAAGKQPVDLDDLGLSIS